MSIATDVGKTVECHRATTGVGVAPDSQTSSAAYAERTIVGRGTTASVDVIPPASNNSLAADVAATVVRPHSTAGVVVNQVLHVSLTAHLYCWIELATT